MFEYLTKICPLAEVPVEVKQRGTHTYGLYGSVDISLQG